ncbi:MAG: 16S rRNA (guanine(527)-N(7))-methyltransferase RsmG [Phycisphaerae bacterium]|nr:16S rRNA (guanine(527)-N(7))-methyltransferase RsmG [Phycisphaerae bacterium]
MNTAPLDLKPACQALEAYRAQFDKFAQMLIEANQTRNLTRITDPSHIPVRHFLDSLAALAILDQLAGQTGRPLRIADIGSGAGLPALALAIARPDWAIVSVEATEKKVQFQQAVCAALKLTNVQLLTARAEIVAHSPDGRQRFDAATARAVAPLPIVAELSLGLVRQGGIGLFWKGRAVAGELAQGVAAVRQMGAAVEQLADYCLQIPQEPPAELVLVVCRKMHSTPAKLPRAFGQIKKRPLTDN